MTKQQQDLSDMGFLISPDGEYVGQYLVVRGCLLEKEQVEALVQHLNFWLEHGELMTKNEVK